MALVPLKLYFNVRGIAKLELGLGKGKKQFDKREAQKKRDWDRQKARLLREKGEITWAFYLSRSQIPSKTSSNICSVRRPVFVLYREQ